MSSTSSVSARPGTSVANPAFVPIRLAPGGASLDVAIVARRNVEPREALVPLRQTPMAIAYLACLLDADATVHGWLELWLQRFDGASAGAASQSNTNANRDRAFAEWRTALASVDPAAVIALPPMRQPLAIDVASTSIARRAEDGLALCTDDAALEAAGLPRYSNSSIRYLSSADGADGRRFVALSDDAPIDGTVQSLAERSRLSPTHLPFNSEAGDWFATRWLPASFEEHLGLIEGEGWTPPLHGRTPVPTDAAASAIRQQDAHSVTSLFLTHRSPQQRLAEALHLKLLALRSAVHAVAAATRAGGRPMLSVQLDSFRVGYSMPTDFSPVLWSAHVHLVTPSSAVDLPASANGPRMFISSDTTRGSVFAADAANAPRSGRVNLRIRQSLPERGQGHIIEATLSSVETIAAAPGDELWLSVLTTAGTVPLLGSVDNAGVDRTLRFRSRVTPLTEAQSAWFEQSAGVAVRDVPFELLRTRGSPSDLYSLGVLGLRCLFGGPGAPPLGVTVDDVVALAQADGDDLVATLTGIFGNEASRREHLGPRFLIRETASADDAFDAIPLSLWASTIATIARMLSGTSRNSTCPDLVGAGADAGVFDRALGDLAALLVQTRSLVLNELHYNRRVAGVVDAMMNQRSRT